MDLKRFETQSISFTLAPADIDSFSEWVDEVLAGIGVERGQRLRSRLALEETLLNLSDHYGVSQEIDAYLERGWGHYRLRLKYKGDRFNPLRSTSEDMDDWSMELFSMLGMRLQYSYSVDSNSLLLPLVVPSMNPVLKIIIAIAVGVALGIVGNLVLPEAARQTISNVVLMPISDMWIRFLQSASGPIIFFTAITTALSTKRISDHGGSAFTTVLRYFLVSILLVAFAILCAVPILNFTVSSTYANAELANYALDQILAIIPSSVLDPFNKANTPQLLLVAIVTGAILASLGTRVSTLTSVLKQINMVGLTLAQGASTVVPYITAVVLCLRIWGGNLGVLGTMWRPLLMALVLSLIVLAVALFLVAGNVRVSPGILLDKLREPFIRVLKEGSIDPTVDDLVASCHKRLGISAQFAEASLPQGLVLFMPISAIGIIVFSIFVARSQGLEIDQLWVVSAAILAVVLFVATPPVSGANLLAYVVFFGYLGISSNMLMDAMVFDIIFGVFANAANQAMLQLETLAYARRLGFLDVAALHKP